MWLKRLSANLDFEIPSSIEPTQRLGVGGATWLLPSISQLADVPGTSCRGCLAKAEHHLPISELNRNPSKISTAMTKNMTLAIAHATVPLRSL